MCRGADPRAAMAGMVEAYTWKRIRMTTRCYGIDITANLKAIGDDTEKDRIAPEYRAAI